MRGIVRYIVAVLSRVLRALLFIVTLPDINDVISALIVSYWKVGFLLDSRRVDRLRYLQAISYVLDKQFGYRHSIIDLYDDSAEDLSDVREIDRYIDSNYNTIIRKGTQSSDDVNKVVFVVKRCAGGRYFFILCCVNHYYIDGTHFHLMMSDIGSHYLNAGRRDGVRTLCDEQGDKLDPRRETLCSVVRYKFLPVSFSEADSLRAALSQCRNKEQKQLTTYNSLCALWALYLHRRMSSGSGSSYTCHVAHTVNIRRANEARNPGNYIKVVLAEVRDSREGCIADLLAGIASSSQTTITDVKRRYRRAFYTLVTSSLRLAAYRPIIIFDNWCMYRHLAVPPALSIIAVTR